MPSFDVVSEVEAHALTNAVDQAGRIIANRFDFKGVKASFERKNAKSLLLQRQISRCNKWRICCAAHW